jgi:mRNA-degrading endonuclease RelE of RelBE toxin-antitoxin system
VRFEFKPSFDRSIKSLPRTEKADVKEAASQLIDVLSKERQIHQGLGLKRLLGDFWEVRRGINVRILFRRVP